MEDGWLPERPRWFHPVILLSGPLLCQEGSQRARLYIQAGRWQAKNTFLHARRNTVPLFTCLLTPPDLFSRLSQEKSKTHLAENNTCVIIRLRHAWPRSCKQKHAKNTHIWLEKVFISPTSCCFHLALMELQCEKVILQFSLVGCLHSVALVHPDIEKAPNLKFPWK